MCCQTGHYELCTWFVFVRFCVCMLHEIFTRWLTTLHKIILAHHDKSCDCDCGFCASCGDVETLSIGTGIVLRTSQLIIFLCNLVYICAFQTSLLPSIISAVFFVAPTNWKASLNAQYLVYCTMRERWKIGCMSRLI